MVVTASVWHGSTDEALRMVVAVGHHCQCGELRRRCPAHEMILSQHFVDHVLFLRWVYLREVEQCISQLSEATR